MDISKQEQVWESVSGANGKRTWWVYHKGNRQVHRGKSGNLITFASREAAQKRADELNEQDRLTFSEVGYPHLRNADV